jgi:ethanolamine ammonia-lyase large subunit
MCNRTEEWIFSLKENYEEVLKYHEESPCNNCVDKDTCLNAEIDNDGNYVIVSNLTCEEANEWFLIAEHFDDFIDDFKMLPEGLLGIRDIEKLIQLGDRIDLAEKMGLTKMNESTIGDFYIFASSLNELLSIFDKDEIMGELIIPFIEDQSKLLEESQKQYIVCD